MLRICFVIVMGVVLTSIFCNSPDLPLQELSNVEIQEFPEIERKPKPDIFVEAERMTGFPAEVLRGIAGVESHFMESAVGDNGMSQGMFQLHRRWHSSRIEQYGEFDPFDPADAAIIAGYIMRENLRSFEGDLRLAIAAYKQGVTGVNRDGAVEWYVNAVLTWRNDYEKMFAFFVFQGITNIEGMEDGHIDFGA